MLLITWMMSAAMAGPLSEHLRDAIDINKARRPLYAEATDGQSRAISRRLIWSERVALLLSPAIDIPARHYQRHGVPLLEEEIVSMDLTPDFQARALPPPQLDDYAPLPTHVVEDELWLALDGDGFEATQHVAERWLDVASSEPRFGCMTRHMLESIAAIAALAPTRAAQAEEAGLRDPGPLLRRLLRQHIRLLGAADALDQEAAPMQAEGVPILCQDVPPIPTPPGA